MRISSSLQGTKLVIQIVGEIDHHSAKEIMSSVDERVQTAAPRDCVLDFAKVTFMDSSGIAIILKSYRLLKAAGGRLWIENVPSQPMRVMDASGIERLVKISALN